MTTTHITLALLEFQLVLSTKNHQSEKPIFQVLSLCLVLPAAC